MAAWLRSLGASAVLLVAGCASTSEDTKDYDRRLTEIESLPSGTEVTVNGLRVGRTPTRVALRVDESGRLVEPIEIAGEVRVLTPVPGPIVFESVSIRWEAGDIPPRQVKLAAASAGGSRTTGDSR